MWLKCLWLFLCKRSPFEFSFCLSSSHVYITCSGTCRMHVVCICKRNGWIQNDWICLRKREWDKMLKLLMKQKCQGGHSKAMLCRSLSPWYDMMLSCKWRRQPPDWRVARNIYWISSCRLPVWWPENKNSPTISHACRKRWLKWVATLPLGDINTEAWSSRIGVGRGANNPTL
jgi:hypothetical protein